MLEFRVNEKFAPLVFDRTEGKRLGDSVRQVVLATADPRVSRIADLQKELREKQGEPFFFGWDYKRRYAKAELDRAELFHCFVTSVFQPAGEECGTTYDESVACQICGAGRTQRGNLRLDVRKIPKRSDISRTIAYEIVVSQRLAEMFVDSGVTGIELRPIIHSERGAEDAIDLTKSSSGRALIVAAESAGLVYLSSMFWVWLNRPEQRWIYNGILEKYAENMQRRVPKQLPAYYQLLAVSSSAELHSSTVVGNGPFDLDTVGRYRCPLGHTVGLNILSEVTITRPRRDGINDFVCTRQMVGVHRGLLRPHPLLLMSPRLQRLLHEHKITGYSLEVAHLH